MKVFFLDECDYVAAETLDDALDWYKRETGAPDIEEWSEVALDQTFWTGEIMGDGEELTFAEAIRLAHENKERFPQILATDSYYA